MQSHDFTYKTGDNGEPLSALVHWSKNSSYNSERSKPIVIILHLGGFTLGSNAFIPTSQINYLAEQNFVVVLPNYRLCPQVSALAGPFADTASAAVWCRKELPSLLKDSHDVAVDLTRLAVMGQSCGGTLALWLATQPDPPRAIASFYPSLYISDASSNVHQPYAGFEAVPEFESTPANLDAVYNPPGGVQLSSFPLPLPGTTPQLRHHWFFTQLRSGNWVRAIQPDGNWDIIDPCVHFAEKAEKWPPTMFVQGDKDDIPGSGIGPVERAVAELERAGAANVKIERVQGQPHGFDMFPGAGVQDSGRSGEAVKSALDFLRTWV